MQTEWSDSTIIDELAKATPRPHYYYLRRALRRGNTILEVGCATSALFNYLSDGPPMEFSGCDLTTEMLERSRETHPNAKYFEADVQQMAGVDDSSYDWVICSDVLIHVPDPDTGLKQLWRVAGGALLVVVRESDYPEDVIDRNRAYQDGRRTRFHYNVWNRENAKARIRALDPPPTAVDTFRYWIHLPPQLGGPVLPFDHSRYPLWASTYVLLKDANRVAWQGAANQTFSKRNPFQRAMRKARVSVGRPSRWDPV